MLSGFTYEGAKITFQALELGALDFVPKPSTSVSINIKEIQKQLASIYPNKSLELTSEPIVKKSNINDISYIPDIPIVAKQTVHL